MAIVKLLISFFAIAIMGYVAQRDSPKDWPEEDMWKFEIPMAILAAGWIAHDGW